MSQTLQDLKNAAELEKKAYFDYVKAFSSSAIVELVNGGMPFEKAAQIAKEACDKNPKAIAIKSAALALEKTAAHVEELEKKAETVEVIEVTKVLNPNDPMAKLASIGFTPEELENMNYINDALIEKVASAISANPSWEMGAGVGSPLPNMDPFTAFLYGR